MKKARTEEWIATYLSGNMNPGEQEELMDWMNKNSDNQTFFDNAVKIWSAADDYVYPDFSKGKSKAWDRLDNRLQSKPQAKVRRLPFWRISIAASIALLIAAGWWGFNNLSSNVTLATNFGEQQEVVLPDGSKIWLNQNSELTYTENGTDRTVTLTGEAFFEVETDSLRPFKIYAGQSLTTVMGTSFNVRAYPDEPTVEVSVTTGKVSLKETEEKANEVMLIPGETGVSEANQTVMKKEEQSTENTTAWKTGRLKFDETKMPEVIEDLERYFGVEIKIENPAILNCLYTATFPQPTLDEIIDNLQFNLTLKLDQNAKTITLKGEGCQ